MADDPYANHPARPAQGSTLAMVAHLGGIFTYVFLGWVASLVVWLTSRETDRALAEEARAALNFQLTALIGMFVMQVLSWLPVLWFLGELGKAVIGIAALVLSLVAAAAVYRGGSYRYPYSLELVR